MQVRIVDEQFIRMVGGYCIATAEILYAMPDHRDLVQLYIWQDYDMAPSFPKLYEFLDFWEHKLDGPLLEVTVVSSPLINKTDYKPVDSIIYIH